MRRFFIPISGIIFSSGMAMADITSHANNMDHGNMAMDEAMAEDRVHVKAIVNSFGEGTVNVSHDPIPEIGWPAMTMDMPLMANAEIMGQIEVGTPITMMLVKGDDGMYSIAALIMDM